jgi:hypothetical protein
MQVEFIPYEQALALKELGFNEPCFGIWIERGNKHDVMYVAKQEDAWMAEQNDGILAPLYQQAFRWFREKHRLYHVINMFGDWDKPQYSYIVSGKTMGNPAHMWYYEDVDSYEEAELATLIKLIEIVKTKYHERRSI